MEAEKKSEKNEKYLRKIGRQRGDVDGVGEGFRYGLPQIFRRRADDFELFSIPGERCFPGMQSLPVEAEELFCQTIRRSVAILVVSENRVAESPGVDANLVRPALMREKSEESNPEIVGEPVGCRQHGVAGGGDEAAFFQDADRSPASGPLGEITINDAGAVPGDAEAEGQVGFFDCALAEEIGQELFGGRVPRHDLEPGRISVETVDRRDAGFLPGVAKATEKVVGTVLGRCFDARRLGGGDEIRGLGEYLRSHAVLSKLLLE